MNQVPPMSAAKTRTVIEQELQGTPIDDVFEWIQLDSVLGSASIAQVRILERQRKSPDLLVSTFKAATIPASPALLCIRCNCNTLGSPWKGHCTPYVGLQIFQQILAATQLHSQQ